jgi:two-component system, OmpR family, alkaline phosphatase synthesis response regulator PhoP
MGQEFKRSGFSWGGKMPSKILIADDEALIRLLITQTLEDFEDQGVEILTAKDGEEALQIVLSEQPELVFLDVMMPKINGFEVCQTIKHDPRVESTYVVLLTANGQDIDHLRGQQVGANVYMTKPFDPDELIHLTEKVLGG